MISIEKRVEKLSIPGDCMLVEVVSQDNGKNHMVYYLAEDRSIIDFVHVVNTRISDVIRAIPHMMVINFTEGRFWQMAMETMMYNRIFEIDPVRYDDFSYWAMDSTMVELFRHWCKIITLPITKKLMSIWQKFILLMIISTPNRFLLNILVLKFMQGVLRQEKDKWKSFVTGHYNC